MKTHVFNGTVFFFFPASQIREEWRANADKIWFNFYSHPSTYIPMTILKLFSYWQMLQCFGNKSWTKTGALNTADTILNNWISLAVYTLAPAPWREAAQKPRRSWIVPIQQRCNDPCFFQFNSADFLKQLFHSEEKPESLWTLI